MSGLAPELGGAMLPRLRLSDVYELYAFVIATAFAVPPRKLVANFLAPRVKGQLETEAVSRSHFYI